MVIDEIQLLFSTKINVMVLLSMMLYWIINLVYYKTSTTEWDQDVTLNNY